MSATVTERTETTSVVPFLSDATLCWNYDHAEPALDSLYTKGTESQWTASSLDWTTDVDMDAIATRRIEAQASSNSAFNELMRGWPLARRVEYEQEWLRYTLSQIFHSEQLALILAARLTISLAPIEAKLFASTQVVDEARHVEVFSRYVTEKLGDPYPVVESVRSLLEDSVADPRWDVLFLSSQVVVEGFAIAVFSVLRRSIPEPLLQQMLKNIIRDEARHVAFGAIGLGDFYSHLSASEIRERQEIVFDCAQGMVNRSQPEFLWREFGLTGDQIKTALGANKSHALNAAMFSKVVPMCARIGLLDGGDGWLRDRFRDLGVLVFEK